MSKNTNCLEDRRCPKCAQEDALLIEALKWVEVTDNGVDGYDGDAFDAVYDEDSQAKCTECGYRGKWADFDIENQLETIAIQPRDEDQHVIEGGAAATPRQLQLPVTCQDVDRILGLGDEFLEDWESSAEKDGESTAESAERRQEWDIVRPLLVAAPKMFEALVKCEDLLRELAAGDAENPELEIVRVAIEKAKGGAQ